MLNLFHGLSSVMAQAVDAAADLANQADTAVEKTTEIAKDIDKWTNVTDNAMVNTALSYAVSVIGALLLLILGMIVAKAVNMAGLMKKPVIGLVENMSYFVCPDCGKEHHIFGASKVEATAKEYGIPCTAQLPIDPAVAALVDEGKVEQVSGSHISALADYIVKEV